MAWTIIIASSDPAQLELLNNVASAISVDLAEGATIREAESIAALVRQYGRVRDHSLALLIVTAPLIDDRPQAAPDPYPGLTHIAGLQASPSPAACILISQEINHLPNVQEMPRCEMLPLQVGTNYVKQCKNLARKLGVGTSQDDPTPAPDVANRNATDAAAPDMPQPAARCAWIDIAVPQSLHGTIKLEIVDPDGLQSESVPVDFLRADIDDVMNRSRDLTDYLSKALASGQQIRGEWETQYRDLGDRIYRMLWKKPFDSTYSFAIGKVGADNVRIRFGLAPELMEGLWEAAFNEDGRYYLVSKNTVARRLALGAWEGIPMTKPGGEELRILFVKSQVTDNSRPDGPNDALWREYITDIGPKLPRLKHLDEELEALEAVRDSLAQMPRSDGNKPKTLSIKTITRRLDSRKKGSLADDMERELATPGSYDVVLFAGHALFAPGRPAGDQRGYLVFSGHPAPKAVPIAVVAEWLKKAGVQLVHLSCCRSAAARTAMEFAQNGIAMTIGFTWDLDDQKAVDFTQRFYTELLSDSRLNICKAFASARRRLLNQYANGDPIWASPVLVAQPQNCVHVEGMLRLPLRKSALLAAPIARRRKAQAAGKEPPPAAGSTMI